ncbi:MAG: bifunctional UDP-N-acetylglucosamine diphosphorylase/glucosamine-1-phosphate N-acetyltransferase GlmU [Betaproteobacteria bacterium]|nr:bifunctional UDP-N-acetylglucosamine diphosphorylase/glucosamine-1-phosphate N-acetyltransferase GlmU [Betaproteobacteria bacterium]
MTAPSVVILAAGQGKRMHSALPKVLHRLAGKPLLQHVLEAAGHLRPQTVVVVHGHGAQAVQSAFSGPTIQWALQEPQQGTGHALMQALPLLPSQGTVLVLYGDVPLLQPETLHGLALSAADGALALLVQELDQPQGYGRILRNTAGAVTGIREERDANESERAITEVNTGIMALPAERLGGWLEQLSCNNDQNEYYLTDVVSLAVRDGIPIRTSRPGHFWEALGVNSKKQLAQLERLFQRETADKLLESGVTLADPERLDVRGSLSCGRDVQIDVGCVFEGNVVLEDGVSVGPHCVIRDSHVGAGTLVLPFSHVDGARVGRNCRIGPYARLRPGTEMAAEVHIGNFVEIKNSVLGQETKANHLSYVGDSTVGARVNVGAGTITCNYDGVNKHRTVIEDDVFIGSDTQLVAPVTVGRGATIGAGSTIVTAVPADQLTLSRSKQMTVTRWKRPAKKS